MGLGIAIADDADAEGIASVEGFTGSPEQPADVLLIVAQRADVQCIERAALERRR